MSERDKILTACGWLADVELPLIAERIVNHSADRIAELEADCVTWSTFNEKVETENDALEATIERVRGLPRWEVGDENRRDIVCEDGEFVRWADVQEAIK